MTEKQLSDLIRTSHGDSVELSSTVLSMMMVAYKQGRSDAMRDIGLDEEFANGSDPVAWTL